MDHLCKNAGGAEERANAVTAAVTIDAQGIAHALAKLHHDDKHEYILWVKIYVNSKLKNYIEYEEKEKGNNDAFVAETIRIANFAQLARNLPCSEAATAPGNPAVPCARAALVEFTRVPIWSVGIGKKAAARSCFLRYLNDMHLLSGDDLGDDDLRLAGGDLADDDLRLVCTGRMKQRVRFFILHLFNLLLGFLLQTVAKWWQKRFRGKFGTTLSSLNCSI